MSTHAMQGIVNHGRRAFCALLLALVHLGPAIAEDKAPSILVMGDSLSAAHGLRTEQGWVDLLGRELQARPGGWRVVNASISGETTAGGAARIDDEIARHRPRIVVIELGANDGLRGLPLDIATANLRRMILAAQAGGARVLLVGMKIPPNYGGDYTQAFERMFADLAREYRLPLLPFLLAPIATDRSNFQEDNLHPNAEVQPLLMRLVLTSLDPMLGK